MCLERASYIYDMTDLYPEVRNTAATSMIDSRDKGNGQKPNAWHNFDHKVNKESLVATVPELNIRDSNCFTAFLALTGLEATDNAKSADPLVLAALSLSGNHGPFSRLRLSTSPASVLMDSLFNQTEGS